ncbi:MAG TPA: NUDIX hydrolase [Candidatus Paceibacterota bacterium]|nr:NUDIX hydrolase [Candidatus Paceibacterota bacterium]
MSITTRIRNRLLAPFQLFYWKVRTPAAEGAKVLIACDGRYFLMRETYGSQRWTLPGGRTRRGEDPIETARRRVKEEAGIELDALVPLGSYFHTRQHKKDVIGAYYAEVASPRFRIDHKKVGEAGWFTRAELESLTLSESVDDVFELYEKYQGEEKDPVR